MNASINRFLQSVLDELVSEQRRLGMYASGRSAKSLNITGADNSGELRGLAYWEQQFYGRGPTRNAGNRGVLRDAIRDWLDTKPFANGLNDKEKNGLAYVISRRIHQYGTRRGNDSRYPAINAQSIINKHKPKMIREVGKEEALRYASEIIRGLT